MLCFRAKESFFCTDIFQCKKVDFQLMSILRLHEKSGWDWGKFGLLLTSMILQVIWQHLCWIWSSQFNILEYIKSSLREWMQGEWLSCFARHGTCYLCERMMSSTIESYSLLRVLRLGHCLISIVFGQVISTCLLIMMGASGRIKDEQTKKKQVFFKSLNSVPQIQFKRWLSGKEKPHCDGALLSCDGRQHGDH